MARDQGSSDGARLRAAIARLNRRLRHADPAASIGPTGLGILALLLAGGPTSASELAQREHVQPQSLTRVLAALERAKLIGRKPDPGDRRRAKIWILPHGESLLRTTMRKRVAWLNSAIDAQLSGEERETLRAATEILERLAGHCDTNTERDEPRTKA